MRSSSQGPEVVIFSRTAERGLNGVQTTSVRGAGAERIRRSGRVAEGAPLLREYTLIAYRGFESLLLRHHKKGTQRSLFSWFQIEHLTRILAPE